MATTLRAHAAPCCSAWPASFAATSSGTYRRAMTAHGDVALLVAGPPGRRVRLHLVTHPDGVQQVLAGNAANSSSTTSWVPPQPSAFASGPRRRGAPVPLATAITLGPARPVRCEVVARQPTATAPAAAPRSPGRT